MAREAGDEGLKPKRVSFSSGKLTLEGLCYFPEGDGLFPAVIMCHPHPLFGGSMDNNVILSIGSKLAQNYIVAFMFNFRGVGRSQGRFGGGIDEQEDAVAAVSWIMSQPGLEGSRLGLAGYSFGATMALPVAVADDRVKALALISMPPGPEQISQLKKCTKPKLIISGTDDVVVPAEQAKRIGKEAAEPKQFELIKGADHIWWGHESALAGKVASFFKQTL